MRFWYLIAFTLIAGCGGGGGGDSDDDGGSVSEGSFWDTRVGGLEYSTDTQSGITDVNGDFNYSSGETVIFSIGDIELGSLSGRAIVTPIDLVGVSDPANDTVVNISRFLQTLDDDGDTSVSSGITITSAIRTAAVGKSINFNQTASSFEMDANVVSVVAELTALRSVGVASLVDSATAEAHLRTTLDNIFVLALGAYTGSSVNTQSNCSDSSFNRTTTSTGTLTLQSRIDGSTSHMVSGEATFSVTIQGITVREELTFTNVVVNYLGEMNGSANASAYVNDVFQGSGSASFTGTLDRNRITIKFPSEANKVMGGGIICDVAGASITVTKNIQF